MGQRGTKGVLFLCTGNYYRSRFAEVLFNSVAGQMGLPWRAHRRRAGEAGLQGEAGRRLTRGHEATAPAP